ncbi:MAG: hypothetical protein AAF696_38915, partial [Bacteroidota bacterium]
MCRYNFSRQILYVFLGICSLFGCQSQSQEDKKDLIVEPLNPIESIDRFHDSIPVPIVFSIKKIKDQYVLIGANQNKITFLDSNFNFITYAGREGKGPGEFLSPFALVVINNKVFVNDMGN